MRHRFLDLALNYLFVLVMAVGVSARYYIHYFY